MKFASLSLSLVVALSGFVSASEAQEKNWASDPVWHDGLVEKAVYEASRVVYNRPRPYEMIVFTNKEQHDVKTLTKAEKSTDTVEVWKHNQVEVIPTPNYDYKYTTTSHYTTDQMELTRLDCSSQEFCGTSFKQYEHKPGTGAINYWAFSYMPEAGRKTAEIERGNKPVYAIDALPLLLRDFDFEKRETLQVTLLPGQKSNRHTPDQPMTGEIRFVGEDGDSYKLEVHADGKLLGTYWMAKDRLHVMTGYQSADGQQTYKLKDLSRANYWTIKGE